MCSVQLQDTNRKEGAECIAQLASAIKYRRSECNLPSIIKHAQVEKGTWEEDSFDKSEEETTGHKAPEAVDCSGTCGHGAPESHRCTDVYAGVLDLADEKVRWYLHQD